MRGWNANRIKPAKPLSLAVLTIALCLSGATATGTGPRKEGAARCVRYGLPADLQKKPFYFVGELIPLKRPDVEARVLFHINYLLLDARGALTDWLAERGKYSWIFEEIFAKENVPKEFALLSPILSGLSSRTEFKGAGAGWWFLAKPCAAAEGVAMAEDGWHDDRLDLELSTRCFAKRIKRLHKELGERSWLMTAAAYLTSEKTIESYSRKWNTDQFWDLPLPEVAEELVVRWMAFAIINGRRESYDIQYQDQRPFTYDQITGVSLKKDLSVADLAKILETPPREALELNPKLKGPAAFFPAADKGQTIVHSISAPKDKGSKLLNALRKEGYVADGGK
jgi:hypothetical protein